MEAFSTSVSTGRKEVDIVKFFSSQRDKKGQAPERLSPTGLTTNIISGLTDEELRAQALGQRRGQRSPARCASRAKRQSAAPRSFRSRRSARCAYPCTTL